MELLHQYQKISRLLKHDVKLKIRRLAHLYAERAHSLQTPHNLSEAAILLLKPHFPRASRQELEVLAFYLLGLVVAAKGDIKTAKETVKDKLDSLSEMGEMESLRLQMAMDRMSKFMFALSNFMQKASDTSSSITQNIK